MNLLVRYVKPDGTRSDRAVLMCSATDTVFKAYCKLRGEARTFAWRNVQRVVCADTGEILFDKDLHAGICPNLLR